MPAALFRPIEMAWYRRRCRNICVRRIGTCEGPKSFPAEVVGYAMSSDAADTGMPSKQGAERAIACAKNAGLNPEDVVYQGMARYCCEYKTNAQPWQRCSGAHADTDDQFNKSMLP